MGGKKKAPARPERPDIAPDVAQILNACADPIFVKDEQHRWILLNDAF